jgi:hypothetical protein
MWTKLLKRRLALISAMIILLPLATTADDLARDRLIQLIKENTRHEGSQLTAEEIAKLADEIIRNPPPDDYPAGQFCWATRVESYNPGNPKPWPQFSDPEKILNEPDSMGIDHTKSVSLGNTQDKNGPYGEITIRFQFDRFFAQPGKNLYFFEVGTDKEAVYLQVRRQDTGTYYPSDPGLLVTGGFPDVFPTKVSLAQFGVPANVPLDAVRIRDADGGNVGAAAAGADVDAISIDCDSSIPIPEDQQLPPSLPVEILSIEANIIAEGVVVLVKTGVMNNVAKIHLMRVPIKMNGQLDKEKAILISEKNPYPTQIYGALDKLPPPGQYAYVVKEITDTGEQIWHDSDNRGEIAIIEIQ